MTSDDPVEGPVCSGTSNNGGMRCEHLGCFQDNKDDRVLGDMLASDEMTIDVSIVPQNTKTELLSKMR